MNRISFSIVALLIAVVAGCSTEAGERDEDVGQAHGSLEAKTCEQKCWEGCGGKGPVTDTAGGFCYGDCLSTKGCDGDIKTPGIAEEVYAF
jgi:hypothetical protein